jgi:hypothetical protein
VRTLLEGDRKGNGRVNPNAPPPPEWDEYRLARLFGWTPQQIADAPGHWCDWALAFSQLEGWSRG